MQPSHDMEWGKNLNWQTILLNFRENVFAHLQIIDTQPPPFIFLLLVFPTSTFSFLIFFSPSSLGVEGSCGANITL